LDVQFDVSAIVTRESEPYHRWLRASEVRMQRCRACGYLRPPASDDCPECLSQDAVWEILSGRAKVETYIWYFQDILDRRFTQEWAYRQVPYNVALVKMLEGPRVITNIDNCQFSELRVGAMLRPLFVPISPEFAILRFELS
jgi:uncharacterized protein